MAVDYGESRTGIAISDVTEFLASPVCIIKEKNTLKAIDKICEKAAELGAEMIVIGNPVNMDGSRGSRAQRCEKFAVLLKELSGLPVATFDERMTTMTASRYLNETGTHGKKRKQVIDTLSAQIILQNCLDRLKYMN